MVVGIDHVRGSIIIETEMDGLEKDNRTSNNQKFLLVHPSLELRHKRIPQPKETLYAVLAPRLWIGDAPRR